MWWKCSRIIFYIWAQFSTGNKLYFCFLTMTQILNMAISDYDDYGVVWGRACSMQMRMLLGHTHPCVRSRVAGAAPCWRA